MRSNRSTTSRRTWRPRALDPATDVERSVESDLRRANRDRGQAAGAAEVAWGSGGNEMKRSFSGFLLANHHIRCQASPYSAKTYIAALMRARARPHIP